MSLRLHRRSEEGLVPYVPPKGADWRLSLRSPAWRPRKIGFWARQTGARFGVRSIVDTAARPVSALDGVLVFGALAVATFVILAVLRALGLWY